MLAESPDMVVLVPEPFVVVPPGDLVRVHDPDEGNPFNTTLPVARVQVDWVMVPTEGAAGVEGGVLITTFPVAEEVQPEAFVTV